MRSRVLGCLLVVAAGCGSSDEDEQGTSEPTDRAQRTTCVATDTTEVFHFEIFTYEASRPNATDVHAGTGELLPACSEPGIHPWNVVSYEQAQTACEAATTVDGESGFRVCTFDEWELACGGKDHLRFPYSNAETPGRCNDHKTGSQVLPSGSFDYCVGRDYPAFDMVGNVWEWVNVDDDTDGDNEWYAGGSYTPPAGQARVDATCKLRFKPDQNGYATVLVGFRCCRSL